MPEPEWLVKQVSENVTDIKVTYRKAKDWAQWGLLQSDQYIDNPKCQENLLKRHLREAKDRGAFIMSFGDFFCAMQGKFDPRSYKPDLKLENQTGSYLNSLIDSGANLLGPYKENIAVLAEGNHESAIRKRCEYDLTEDLVRRLQASGSQVVKGSYQGWIRFRFITAAHGDSKTINLHYTHGGGGGGPVTKGVIKTNRRAVYLPDAHIVVGGHIHESWHVELPRARVTERGGEYADTQDHICLPTYKEEFIGVGGGFHHEGERPPKPLGAWWVKFFYCGIDNRVKWTFERAR